MTTTLTILGASVRAAAQSAARAGFGVVAGDLFADLDLRQTCQATAVAGYPGGLEAVAAGGQDGPWMFTGALENHPALVARMARVRPLWGNPAQVLRAVRDPERVSDALRRAGLRCPQTRRATDPPRDGTWLVKPLRSAGGMHISRWSPSASNAESMGTCFQQYIEGSTCAAVYVAAAGSAVLLGVTRQLSGQAWAGAGEFRYCGSIGPLDLPHGAIRAFVDIGRVLAREFDLLGLFGVDAVVDSDGVWPVEINPRYTASTELLDWSCGVSTVAVHTAACQHGQLPAGVLAPNRCCGKAIVFAERRLVVPSGWSDSIVADHQDWPALADIPLPGTTIEAGWPIVTVFAEGTDEREVLERLKRQAASVRASLA